MRIGKWLSQILARLPVEASGNIQYSKPRFLALSGIGAIAFPLYYLVWHDLFPQPYENLGLRLLGCTLFIPLVFVEYWPNSARKWLRVYWYITILYALPFFFTFMLLMNQHSTAWLMSALAAIFLMVLLLDGLNLCIQLIVGIALAYLLYYFTDHNASLQNFPWEYLPVYLFAILTGIASNFNREKIEQAKLNAMLAAASNIAHELRTPLLGIKSGAAGLNQYLPRLLETYALAKQENLPVPHIRKAHLEAMQHVLARIDNEVSYSNNMIDMLLMNAQSLNFDQRSFENLSMLTCIQQALARYPFNSEYEQKLIHVVTAFDFEFQGSALLMTHVLFNLLKNALYHIAEADKGQIYIAIAQHPEHNLLCVKDTACGIHPEVLPRLFTPFFSWSNDSQRSTGTGLGLAFCRSVIESFGGTISCNSQYGEYTEFIMSFPKKQNK